MDADPGLVVARWLFYGTAMVLFGASLFPVYALAGTEVPGGRLTRGANVSLASAALVAGMFWLARTAAMLGDPGDWPRTLVVLLFESDLGIVWLVRLSAGAVLLIGALAGQARTMIVAGAVLLGCEGWNGHAAAWSLTGSAGQAVHVLCAAAWIGGLVPLSLVVEEARRRGDAAPARQPLQRFSNAGLVFVLLIVATGSLNTWHMLPGSGFSPAYAQVLALKVVLVGVMIAVATLNRNRFIGGSADGPNLKALVFSICAEQIIASAVLLDVSALGLLNPFG